jgi:hypothetical protein
MEISAAVASGSIKTVAMKGLPVIPSGLIIMKLIDETPGK